MQSASLQYITRTLWREWRNHGYAVESRNESARGSSNGLDQTTIPVVRAPTTELLRRDGEHADAAGIIHTPEMSPGQRQPLAWKVIKLRSLPVFQQENTCLLNG